MDYWGGGGGGKGYVAPLSNYWGPGPTGPPLPTPMYKNPELPMIAMQTQEICEGWCKSLLISEPKVHLHGTQSN